MTNFLDLMKQKASAKAKTKNMLYTTTIEDKYENKVEVTVNFDMGEDGVEINTIHDHAGNDVEPYDQWALEQECDEYYADFTYGSGIHRYPGY